MVGGSDFVGHQDGRPQRPGELHPGAPPAPQGAAGAPRQRGRGAPADHLGHGAAAGGWRASTAGFCNDKAEHLGGTVSVGFITFAAAPGMLTPFVRNQMPKPAGWRGSGPARQAAGARGARVRGHGAREGLSKAPQGNERGATGSKNPPAY